MNDYIIELVTGKHHPHNRVKAENLDNLRLRLIRSGLLEKEEKAVVLPQGRGRSDRIRRSG